MTDRSVRDRILDGAAEVAAVHGLAKLSVGDVARQAGLSRQTLYKHFVSKDALVADFVLREAALIVEAVVAATEPHDDPEAALHAAVLTLLQLTRAHPLLDRLTRTEPEALLPLLIADNGPVFTAVRAVCEQIVGLKLPGLEPVELRCAADLLSRLLLSYAVSAPTESPESVAAFLASVLATGMLQRTRTR